MQITVSTGHTYTHPRARAHKHPRAHAHTHSYLIVVNVGFTLQPADLLSKKSGISIIYPKDINDILVDWVLGTSAVNQRSSDLCEIGLATINESNRPKTTLH